MKILAHDRGRRLQLGLEPRRGVWKALLSSGEAVVGGDERLREALGDPSVRFPDLPPQHDEMLRRKRARPAEVLLLDLSELRKQASDRSSAWTIGLRTRRAVDRLQLA